MKRIKLINRIFYCIFLLGFLLFMASGFIFSTVDKVTPADRRTIEVVKPEELRTTNIRSQYKASDDVLHEEERDTLKEWNNKKGFKVLFGIENQTIKDKKMPLRVIAYDGASYRSQMLKKGAKEFCKVITLILHFGDNQWKDDKELREVINQESVNEELFQNYKLNVFDLSLIHI